MVKELIKIAPLPSSLRPNSPPEILKRVLASLAHVALVTGLITVGWWHFERPITGVGMATCYLILPYTRVELVDSTQLVPAALVVTALVFYHRPALAGGLIGLAAWWMPACLGLLPLWFGFYFGRGGGRFALAGLAVVAVLTAWAWSAPDPALWVRAVGARTLADTGLAFTVEAPRDGGIWSRVDVNFRIPVLIGYLTLILVTSIWPLRKNLAELIALSAAQLIACQFWYLDAGGTLILLYLPLVILMMFRPNLAAKRPNSSEPRARLAR